MQHAAAFNVFARSPTSLQDRVASAQMWSVLTAGCSLYRLYHHYPTERNEPLYTGSHAYDGGEPPQLGMSPSKAEFFRRQAEACCRKAIVVEDIGQRLHWLEAAARWISLGREEGALPPRQLASGEDSTRDRIWCS
jgi:hypothetical protein